MPKHRRKGEVPQTARAAPLAGAHPGKYLRPSSRLRNRECLRQCLPNFGSSTFWVGDVAESPSVVDSYEAPAAPSLPRGHAHRATR